MSARYQTDADIRQDVTDELDWDPQVDLTDVGVDVTNGIVTLTGFAPTHAAKMAVERAAFRVMGVRAVVNDIEVRLAGAAVRTDADIAGAIADSFEWDEEIPGSRLRVQVGHGWVTLTGTVDWYYERKAAEDATRRIAGVRGITNEIAVMQTVASEFDVKEAIERALVRSAEVDAEHIHVHFDGSRVTLTGTVRSWAESKEAEEAAWKGRGVTAVTNMIQVRTHPERVMVL